MASVRVPISAIANINSLALHGHDNWRIPTPDELAVLEANADKIGLGDDIYLATDHRNGVLRLVATGTSDTKKVEEDDVIVIGGVKWAKKNVGASTPEQKGYVLDKRDIHSFTPSLGWKLPKAYELKILNNYRGINSYINDNDRICTYTIQDGSYSTKKIIFPYEFPYMDYWCIDGDGDRSIMRGSNPINLKLIIVLVKRA